MELARNGRIESPSAMMCGRHAQRYGIVGQSRAVTDLIQRIELVSATRSTVLITGETGTGKELVARAVHDRSAQKHLPFVKVNCAAIPETLLESELFGHVRGAFTGATGTKKGKFALAHRGSIFLDEIATLTPDSRPSCCGYCRNAKSSRSGRNGPSTWTFASSRRPTATSVSSWTKVGSRTICIIACT